MAPHNTIVSKSMARRTYHHYFYRFSIADLLLLEFLGLPKKHSVGGKNPQDFVLGKSMSQTQGKSATPKTDSPVLLSYFQNQQSFYKYYEFEVQNQGLKVDR